MLVIGGNQLLRAGHFGGRAVQMIAQHEQERLVADRLARAVDRVPESLLRRLRHERNPAPDFQDAPRVLLEMPGQLVVVLDGDLLLEKRRGNRSGHFPER